MTWLKLSDDFDLELGQVGLSAEAFRLHVQGLLWVMRKETGGALSRRAVTRLSDADDFEAAADELASHGFWRAAPDGWVIVHGMGDQPTPEQIAAQRANTTARQAKYRQARMGKPNPPDGGEPARNAVTNGVTNGVSTCVTSGRVGTGRDGSGFQASLEAKTKRTREETTEPEDAIGCAAAGCDGWGPVVPGSRFCADHSDDVSAGELPLGSPLVAVPDLPVGDRACCPLCGGPISEQRDAAGLECLSCHESARGAS